MPRAADLALGWPRLCALTLGAFAALGFEPLGLWPLTLLGIAGLITLLRAAPHRIAAFRLGWCFGLGMFAISLNWLPTAFTFQAALPVWLGWVAELIIAAYLALYPGLAALAAWPARRRPVALVLALAAGWILAEALRGWALTGFPWNPLGAVLVGTYDSVGAARLLPWLGTYALSGLAVLLGGLWYLGLMQFRRDRRWLASRGPPC